MDYSDILYDVDGHIATITLDRPAQLNAFTNAMVREMIDAFNRADADDDVRAVIVTGSGRGFCAGADLSAGAETFAKGGSDVTTPAGLVRDGGGLVSLRIFESLKPVIAAINGPAVGVGITMTLPMDIRLVSTTAKIGFVFARRGIVPEACSSWFLPRLVGISQAAEWCFTGRVFNAEEALAGGLVRSVHEPDELLPAARAIATEIAENASPVSVALTRRMLWAMLTADHPMEAHRVDSRGIQLRGRSGDVREGVESFLAKRPAVFSDRVSDGLPDIFPEPTTRKFS
ncbi:MAG: crotonase/enoyl-CoA hydratase family protein [Ilumatobacteraceae bacterium]